MKAKTIAQYEKQLRRNIESRTGQPAEPWLDATIRLTAMNMVQLDRVQQEISECAELVTKNPGCAGQIKVEANPLLVQYDKMQRTLLQQMAALGLTYSASPQKIKEPTKDLNEQTDRMAQFYKDAKK